jgi:hypothetical protein
MTSLHRSAPKTTLGAVIRTEFEYNYVGYLFVHESRYIVQQNLFRRACHAD